MRSPFENRWDLRIVAVCLRDPQRFEGLRAVLEAVDSWCGRWTDATSRQ